MNGTQTGAAGARRRPGSAFVRERSEELGQGHAQDEALRQPGHQPQDGTH